MERDVSTCQISDYFTTVYIIGINQVWPLWPLPYLEFEFAIIWTELAIDPGRLGNFAIAKMPIILRPCFTL